MKDRQRYYESYDINNIYVKLTDSLIHKKNLESIRNRRSQFESSKDYNSMTERVHSPKKKGFFDLNYLKQVERDNKILNEKLSRISNKSPSPFLLNDEFLHKELQNKINIGKIKKIKENQIKEVNNQLKKRIQDKQAHISVKKLESEFKEIHEKMQNMRKGKLLGSLDSISKKITLPAISNSRVLTYPDAKTTESNQV